MNLLKLFPLVGILILAFILSRIDLYQVWGIISSANVFYLSFAVLMLLPLVAIKSLKWKLLIKSFDVNYPLGNLMKSWTIGFSISMVTPARLGDMSRAYYLKEKLPFGKSLTTVIIDRVIDVFILFVLAIIGIIGFAYYIKGFDLFAAVMLFFALFLLGVYASTKRGFMKAILKPFFKRFVSEKHRGKISLTFQDFYHGLGILRKSKKYLAASILLGIASWLVNIFQYYLLAISLNLNVSYFFLLSIMPLVNLMDILPISFSGIGTRDITLIFFLSQIGIAAEAAVSFSAMLLVFGYLVVGLVGLFFWFRNPIKMREN
jgi:uncharacterized protein (TIRG00374 family)